MEILKEFGFKLELFIAQIINFLILFFVFKRFLYKPILTLMKKREETIKKGLEDAENARILKEETEKNRAEILKKTQAEAEKIIKGAKIQAENLREEMRKAAKEESDRIIADAKSQAQLEMQKIEKKIYNMSLTLSENLLNRVMKGIFTPDERQKILKRTVEKL